jgi:hypothetical protein
MDALITYNYSETQYGTTIAFSAYLSLSSVRDEATEAAF